jgi:hypothetical protein
MCTGITSTFLEFCNIIFEPTYSRISLLFSVQATSFAQFRPNSFWLLERFLVEATLPELLPEGRLPNLFKLSN